MSNYLRDLRRFVGGVGVAMLLPLVTFVSIPDGEAQANSIISQIGADIDGETANYYSGYSVAMSADGSRVAIGATGADGDNGSASGHVRVYTLTNNVWTQTGGDIDETELQFRNLESQGCFPIGSECAKKVGRQFLIEEK